MLDTINLTFQNTSPDALKQRTDGELWTLQALEDGTLQRQQVIQRLNKTPDGKEYNGTLGITYDYKQQFLNVGVSSLPALIHGTSFEVLSLEDMKRITPELEARVSPYVDIDISTGVFTRIDNSTLFSMHEAPSKYIALLDELTRNSQFRMKKTYHQNETLQFRNKQWCIGFYDKYQKNRHNAVEMRFLQTHDMSGKQNALRYEIQNKKAKSIRQHFGKDIRPEDLTTDFFIHRLHQQRVKLFNKHFQLLTSERQAKLEDFINTLAFMKDRHQRSAMDKALWCICLEKQFITMEEMRKVMELLGYPRQTVHRRMKMFAELMSHDIDKTSLFNELKDKIEDTIAA